MGFICHIRKHADIFNTDSNSNIEGGINSFFFFFLFLKPLHSGYSLPLNSFFISISLISSSALSIGFLVLP